MKRLLVAVVTAVVAASISGLAVPANAAGVREKAPELATVWHSFTFTNKTRYKLFLSALSGNCMKDPAGYSGPGEGITVDPKGGAINFNLGYYLAGCDGGNANYVDFGFLAVDPATNQVVGKVCFEADVEYLVGTDEIKTGESTAPHTQMGGVGIASNNQVTVDAQSGY